MSNAVAVAAVTATLARVLRDPAVAAVPSTTVVTERPEAVTGQGTVPPEIRVFLYRVHPDPNWRNQDLPTRGRAGNTLTRPQAALDLDYLVTFAGDDRELEPQRLLGAVVRELHVRPWLERDEIRAAADEADSPVAATDLADQPERVRFTPISLDLEELSRMWSVFFQTPYLLSVAYRASVVLLSPDQPAGTALPVQERRLVSTTIRRPVVQRVVPASGAVVVGDTIQLIGSQLRGEITAVWLGPERVDPAPADIGEQAISVTVPVAARAGVVGVRVEHRRLLGDPPTERPAGSSNVVAVTVQPRIRDDGGGPQVTSELDDGTRVLHVTVDPPIQRRQLVVVRLDRRGTPAGQRRSWTFMGETRDLAGQPETTDEVVVATPGLPDGTYLVRVQVDGVDSPLTRDLDPSSPTFEEYVSPTVTVTTP